jgi:hypothetical protein
VKGFLQSAASILAVVVVVTAIGLTIEWYRRRSIQKWVQEKGGTFEAGKLLSGVAVPEAAPFDGGRDNITYDNVSRIARPEASYTVAQYHTTWRGTKNEVKSFSCVICLVTMPGVELPTVQVSFPSRGNMLASMLGREDTSAPPIPVPGSSPAFNEKFEVTTPTRSTEIKPGSLERLLPKAVQDELVANESLISGFQVRGNAVRLQAVGRQVGYPHQEVFDVAVRLAAAWTEKR